MLINTVISVKGGVGASGISDKDKSANFEDSIFNGKIQVKFNDNKVKVISPYGSLFFFFFIDLNILQRTTQTDTNLLASIEASLRLDPTHPRLIYKHILKFCYIFVHDTFVFIHTLAQVNALSLSLAHTHAKMQSLSHTWGGGVTFSHIQTKSHHQYAYVAIYITAEIVISSLVCPLTFSSTLLRSTSALDLSGRMYS